MARANGAIRLMKVYVTVHGFSVGEFSIDLDRLPEPARESVAEYGSRIEFYVSSGSEMVSAARAELPPLKS
jgi:hypothetical protein